MTPEIEGPVDVGVDAQADEGAAQFIRGIDGVGELDEGQVVGLHDHSLLDWSTVVVGLDVLDEVVALIWLGGFGYHLGGSPPRPGLNCRSAGKVSP